MPPQRKWIQSAVHKSKRGTFTRYAKTKGGMSKGITAGLKSHNPLTRERAQFAKNVRPLAGHRRR